MKRILHLMSSLKGHDQSYSIKLGRAIVDKVVEKYPGSTVEELNLVEEEVPHLSPAMLAAMFTPAEQLTPEGKELARYSEEAIEKLKGADIIVVGAPLYNFTIHTPLKSWMDHVSRAGVTFKYTENGPVGLVTGKKVYVAMSSGGIYSEGPSQAYDFVVPYIKALFGFLGMTDVSVFRAEGVALPELQEAALEKGIASIVVD